MPASTTLRLDRYQGDLWLRVAPGSTAGRTGGVLLATVGGIGVFEGILVTVLGALSCGGNDSGYGSSHSCGDSTLLTGGAMAIASGAVHVAAGIAMLVGFRTRVAVSSHGLAPR